MKKKIITEQIRREILENIPVLIAFYDIQKNIIWANRTYQEATGLSLQEIQNKKCYSIWGANKPCQDCPIQRTIETGEKVEAEFTPENHDHWSGNQGSWRLKAVPIMDDEGNIIGAVEVAFEITECGRTEKRTAENVLKRRMNELSALNRMTTGIMMARNIDELLSYTMEEVLRLVGVDTSAIFLLDEKKKELTLRAHRGLSNEFIQNFNKMKLSEGLAGKVAQTGKPAILRDLKEYPEHRRAFLERDNIQSAVSVPLIGTTGVIGVMNLDAASPKYFDTAGLDMLVNLGRQIAIGVEKLSLTESLQYAEKKYRALVEHNADCILTLDEAGKVIYASPGLSRNMGYDPDEFVGQISFEYIHPEDENRIRGIFQQLIQKTGGSETVECRMRHSSGQWRWIEATGTNLLNEPFVGSIVMNLHDITERKQAEEKLKESEALFRNLFEHHTAVKLLINPDTGSIIDVNAAAAEFYGWTRDQLKQMKIQDINILSPEELNQKMKKVRAEGRGHFEFRHRLADGSIRDVEVFNSKIEIKEKDVLHSIIYDITEHKKMEEDIRAERERLRKILDNIPVMITMYDSRGRVLLLNNEFERIVGWSKEDAEKIDLMKECFPDSEYRKKVIEHMMSTKPRWRDFKVRARKGNIIESAWTNVRLSDRSQIGIGVDISELKAMEQALIESRRRFDLLVSRLNDVIWTATADGSCIIDVNHAFKNVYGITEDELRSNPGLWIEMVHPDDRKIAEASHEQLLKTGWAQTEYRIIRPDGEIRWIRDRKSLIYDEEGRPVQMGGIANDITEIKKKEAEKEKLQEQFIQAQKMEAVGRLAGGVAHDFNNMLSVILGFTDLAIVKLKPSDNIYTDLLEIRKAGQRSANLTRQLLAFARKQTVAPQVLNLNESVAQMLKMLQRLIGEDIEVLWKPGANLWSVKMDLAQVDQILANLAVNARDAIKGVGKLTIETENVIFDETYCLQHHGSILGEYVMLAMSDNGCGMDKETLIRIFEPFFTTKEMGKGTGLGLATVFGIVKQNDGFINVYSEPGQGTTFKIYIPRFTGDVRNEETKQNEELPKGRGETVLIVEDEPQILNLGKRLLENLGYLVLTAANPSEAVRLAQEQPGKIDLLLTDVVMPEMNGRELSHHILAIQPDIKVLFMSGYTANVIEHHGVLEEGVAFIQKPLELKRLATKVREVLEKK